MAILVRGRLWQESRDTVVEFVAVDCAFSVYAGWITAASIVNVVRTPNPIVPLTWRPLRWSVITIVFLRSEQYSCRVWSVMLLCG